MLSFITSGPVARRGAAAVVGATGAVRPLSSDTSGRGRQAASAANQLSSVSFWERNRRGALLATTVTGVTLFSVTVMQSGAGSGWNPFKKASSSSSAAPAAGGASSLGELSGMKDIDGKPLDPAVFAGKVVFAMNVASACGYTKPGYDLLNRLTTKFPQEDFVAVAIPCNSFGWQENGSPDEIKTFALARADKLVITERSEVNGNNPHPIVELAKSLFPGRIGWNFDGRFVFDRNGKPAAKFGNGAKPEEIEEAIQKLI